jgi:hypothetical protein
LTGDLAVNLYLAHLEAAVFSIQIELADIQRCQDVDHLLR